MSRTDPRARGVVVAAASIAVAAVVTSCSSGTSTSDAGPSTVTTPPSTPASTPAPSSSTPAGSTPASTPAPSSSTPVSSTPAQLVAYQAYHRSTNNINNAYGAFQTLAASRSSHDLAGAQPAAHTYRDALFHWDAAVRRITFPASAQPSENRLLDDNRIEIAALDKIATISRGGLEIAVDHVVLDDDAGIAFGHAVEAALGKPRSDAVILQDGLHVVADLFAVSLDKGVQAYNAAEKARDLDGMLAATEAERAAVNDLLIAAGKLPFPTSATADFGRMKHTGQALVAFFQRRLRLTSFSAVEALGDDTAVLTPFLRARDALMQTVDTAASG